ncbi:UNVERIFIED_CONTAM: hypothetical protein Slati_1904400 [Sesamum latifolium]|uniref:Uncharacterized protein n=1 Tax=Sesamum latifolium TaxID=2727402 RepID=A0AAW2X650_9LAMI
MAANKIPALKVAASSSNETIGVITKSMSKKAYPEVTFHETVEKDLLHLGGINEDDGDLKDDSSSFTPRSTSSIVPIMMTNYNLGGTNCKSNESHRSHVPGKQIEAHDEAETSLKQQSNEREKSSTKELQVSSEELIPIDQLKEFIMGTIQNKLDGSTKSFMTYVKPYTRRIDNLKMPAGCQPPKFQQFDGEDNPKQHVAHFIETCNDAGTYGDHLHRRTISMIELTNSHQWEEESVVDYIDRWRNLSLNCKDRLSEASTIEICIQGMHWGLCYILQGVKPKTFEELATRAYAIEITLNFDKREYLSADTDEDDQEKDEEYAASY